MYLNLINYFIYMFYL